MRKLLLAMIAGSLLVNSASAQVGGGIVFCTNCATEPTQVSVKLMHDLEYAKQLLQYAIQVQQLADALKNTLHGGPASLTSIAADLGMLAAVIQGGRALAWSLADDDVVFRETYPGYPALAAVGPPPPAGTYLTGQLAAEQVAQLQKLRELQLEDMTSKAAYQGYQVQKDADMVATEQQFFGPTVINAGDSRVFPTTP